MLFRLSEFTKIAEKIRSNEIYDVHEHIYDIIEIVFISKEYIDNKIIKEHYYQDPVEGAPDCLHPRVL